MIISSICVYCGSSNGKYKHFEEEAFSLGQKLAEKSLKLVYGGGSVGLMGAVADGALSKGGTVIGVIPQDLYDLELGHDGLTELHIVKNMHERKLMMSKLADAFIAMPGGIGTLEELFEVFTWKQLNFHIKPCALFNVNQYYDKLISFLEHSVESGFLKTEHLDALIKSTNIEDLLMQIERADHLNAQKWQ